MMAQNWWDEYPVAGQSGALPSPPPDPTDVRKEARDERRLSIAESAEDRAARKEAEERSRETERQQRATDHARTKLIATVGKIGQTGLDADDNSGWFETGTSGYLARKVLPEGTAGSDLEKNIDTLGARFAFDALEAMREASKTGGALGQVTERELDLLKAATANLDPNQSHSTFMRNVEEARQVYLSKLALVDPEEAARMGYDRKKAEAAWRAINEKYAKELGYDDDVTFKDQTPEDIAEIMKRYGVE